MRFWRDKNATRKKIVRPGRNILVSTGEVKTEKQVEKSKSQIKVKLIMLGIGLIAACYWMFYSNYFLVSDVFVEGNNLVPENMIKELVPIGNNILTTSTKDIENNILSQITEIKDIRVIRGIPDAYKIVVLERTPRMVWQTSEKRYLMSDQGEIIREISADQYVDFITVYDKNNFAVKNGERIVSPNFVAFVVNLDNEFYKNINILPSRYEIQDTTFDLNLYTNENFFVKFNTLRSSNRQLENLKIVLSQKRAEITQYVDLRIDGWAYYK